MVPGNLKGHLTLPSFAIILAWVQGVVTEKINIFKEFSLRERTYELHCPEKKSSTQTQDKQTLHAPLQKLSPRITTDPLTFTLPGAADGFIRLSPCPAEPDVIQIGGNWAKKLSFE